MRRIGFSITLLFFPLLVQSQDSLRLLISIRDKAYKEPIPNVRISIRQLDSPHEKITNQKGNVLISLPFSEEVTIAFAHEIYMLDNKVRSFKRSDVSDTLQLNFEMEAIRHQDIIGTVVTAPGIPKVIYGSDRFHVADFEVLRNGEVVLLRYPKQLKKGSDLALFDGIKIKNRFEMPERAEELIHDFRGNAHVVCENNVFGLHLRGDTLGISTLPKAYYMTYLAPIIDTNKTKLFFSDFNPVYPAFDYSSFDQVDSTYRKIMHIEDELMMELYRSEYKWVDVRTKIWAKDKELQTGIDAEVWVGANYFTQSLYYKELYAPLFHRNDSVFVFDYYKDRMFVFNATGDLLDSAAIYHHYAAKRSGWKRNLIQDRSTGEIYAHYERAGFAYLSRINPKTGALEDQVKLANRYVDKIQVNNNNVYYIYRPFESAQKRYLYSERLPYEFGPATMIENKGE